MHLNSAHPDPLEPFKSSVMHPPPPSMFFVTVVPLFFHLRHHVFRYPVGLGTAAVERLCFPFVIYACRRWKSHHHSPW